MLCLRLIGRAGRQSDGLLAAAVTSRLQVYSRSKNDKVGMKVTICGAAGCTGQPLALMLKQCPQIDEVALYDQYPTCGHAMELSHVDTKCRVSSYSGRHMLCDALKDSRVVIIVAKMCEKDSFENNAPVVSEIGMQTSYICPSAFVMVATEPVESMVPIVAELHRLNGTYDPRKIIGVVETNCVRANTVLADFLRVPPELVRVPVIGGATPQTMVPVLSAAVHPCVMSLEQVECVTSTIMCAKQALDGSKGYEGSVPNLTGAFAIARTAIGVVKGLLGTNVNQVVYCDSMTCCGPYCPYFSSEVVLGAKGIEENLGVPELSKFENCLFCNSIQHVRNEICRAFFLVYRMCTECCTPCCPAHTCTCYQQPCVPCQPPINWTGEYYNPCRDDYIATICRKQTSCCSPYAPLCWRPRPCDAEMHRLKDMRNMMPSKVLACPRVMPASVQYNLQKIGKAMDPCQSNIVRKQE